MKFFLILCLAMISGSAATVRHALLSAVLTNHVHDGRVNYTTLKADPRLDEYLAQLSRTDPATLANDQERLALWLNAYNAYTLKLIVDRAPAKSIVDLGTGGIVLGSLLKTTAWDIRFAMVGGKDYTLNEIEHAIIREKFKDSRAHFALNCASGSCPILRPEAYEAGTLETQLDDQGRQFVQDAEKNKFDLTTKRARLSSIFKWYQGDFGASDQAALLAAARYAPDNIRQAIESDPGAWKVDYLAYDWSLNDTAAK